MLIAIVGSYLFIPTLDIHFFWFLQAIACVLALKVLLRYLHFQRGQSLADQGAWKQAVEHYNWALRLSPKSSEIYTALGNIYADQNRWDMARTFYQIALELNSQDIEACYGLGHGCLREFKELEAHEYFQRAYSLRRKSPKKLMSSAQIGWHKLKHDEEQLSYLLERQLLPPSFQNTLQHYQKIELELKRELDSHFIIELPSHYLQPMETVYDRPLYIESIQLTHPIINPELDLKKIQDDYFTLKPGIVSFDHFLTQSTVDALRHFCLNSTIWHDYTKSGGYLGSYMDDGFSAPFLYEIASAIRQTFPLIFQELPLTYMWAFKYDSQLKGIGLHADNAVVNVNFWITPDEANLDPNSGGLGVYGLEAPPEWDFNDYNSNTTIIQDYLQQHHSPKYTFPYRQNRVVIFNSRLFHETSPFYFKEGYENRRINITMLFGTQAFKYHRNY